MISIFQILKECCLASYITFIGARQCGGGCMSICIGVYFPAHSGCVPALLGSLSVPLHIMCTWKLNYFSFSHDMMLGLSIYHSYLRTDKFIIYIYFIFAVFFKIIWVWCVFVTQKRILKTLSLSLSLSLSLALSLIFKMLWIHLYLLIYLSKIFCVKNMKTQIKQNHRWLYYGAKCSVHNAVISNSVNK